MSYYGNRYTSSVLTKIARELERAGTPGGWGRLMDLARTIEAIVRRVEQDRYEDWRD